jgi:oxygen-independent coproporphyrinogen-3 oxidase
MNSEPEKDGYIQLPPLALYIHLPWCVRKCPYCDFNSHAVAGVLPAFSKQTGSPSFFAT